jgi:hypothetical protein
MMKPTSKEIEEFDELNERDIDAWEKGDVGKNPNHMKVVSSEQTEEFLQSK